MKNQGFTKTDFSGLRVDDDGISFVPIPNGFEYVSVLIDGEETSTVDTGYVIRNKSDGNEFVWIPVDNIEEFITEDGYNEGKLQIFVTQGNAIEPYKEEGYDEAINEYNAMYESVKNMEAFI